MNDSTSDPQDMSQETESSDVAVPAKKAVARKNTRKKAEPMAGVAGDVVLEAPAGFSGECDALHLSANLAAEHEPAVASAAPLSNADVPSDGGITTSQSTAGKREARFSSSRPTTSAFCFRANISRWTKRRRAAISSIIRVPTLARIRLTIRPRRAERSSES